VTDAERPAVKPPWPPAAPPAAASRTTHTAKCHSCGKYGKTIFDFSYFSDPYLFYPRETSSIDIGAVIHHDLGQCVFTPVTRKPRIT
jgi:hypothetical protein